MNKTRYFTSASISVADLSTNDEQNIKKAKIRDTMKETHNSQWADLFVNFKIKISFDSGTGDFY